MEAKTGPQVVPAAIAVMSQEDPRSDLSHGLRFRTDSPSSPPPHMHSPGPGEIQGVTLGRPLHDLLQLEGFPSSVFSHSSQVEPDILHRSPE